MKQLNEILINDESLVRDIQNTFNACYPFLKIEFFHNAGGGLSAREKIVDPANNFMAILSQSTSKKLNLGNSRTVSEITDDIKTMSGLGVKIFRKSGTVWNLISITANWTLESQNEAGEFICKEMATVPTV